MKADGLVNKVKAAVGRPLSKPRTGHVVVLGLGRFGRAFARQALVLGYEVVAVDADQAVVDDLADQFPYCFRADVTSRRALEELSVETAELVLVAIGADIEASLLAVSTLVDMGVERVWAKARSTRHRDILTKIGAHRVSQPETSEGTRLAHQLRAGTYEFVPLDEQGFSVTEVETPADIIGQTLGSLNCRARWSVSVVALKHPDGRFSLADDDMVVKSNDLLVVVGTSGNTERFLRQR